MKEKIKIPVTVITGFLGAGKTTFINQILKINKEIKFALVENEFGEIDIDTKLIKGIDASQMFELKNGCICCTISNEYEQALQELAAKFQDVGHLLIETTGIADPAAIIRPFFADENLRNIYRFNGTVCIADAMNFQQYPAKRIAEKQIAVADTIVISKTENFSAADKEHFQHKIKQLNPLARYFVSDFGYLHDFDLNHIQQKTPKYITVDNENHEYLQAKTIRLGTLNKLKFTNRLSYNLDLYKNEIYRIKGILCFDNEPYQYILQGVGGSFELFESDEITTTLVSEIVVIGSLKNVDLSFFTQE